MMSYESYIEQCIKVEAQIHLHASLLPHLRTPILLST